MEESSFTNWAHQAVDFILGTGCHSINHCFKKSVLLLVYCNSLCMKIWILAFVSNSTVICNHLIVSVWFKWHPDWSLLWSSFSYGCSCLRVLGQWRCICCVWHYERLYYMLRPISLHIWKKRLIKLIIWLLGATDVSFIINVGEYGLRSIVSYGN